MPLALEDNICAGGYDLLRLQDPGDFAAPMTPPWWSACAPPGQCAWEAEHGRSSPWAPPRRPPFGPVKPLGPVPGPRQLLRRGGRRRGRGQRVVRHQLGYRQVHPPAAACCGVTGMKPTWNRLPVRPRRLRLLPGPAGPHRPAPPPTAPRCWTSSRDRTRGTPPTASDYGACRLPHRRRAGRLRVGPFRRSASRRAGRVRSRTPCWARPTCWGAGAVVEFSLPVMDYAVPAYYIIACAGPPQPLPGSTG